MTTNKKSFPLNDEIFDNSLAPSACNNVTQRSLLLTFAPNAVVWQGFKECAYRLFLSSVFSLCVTTCNFDDWHGCVTAHLVERGQETHRVKEKSRLSSTWVCMGLGFNLTTGAITPDKERKRKPIVSIRWRGGRVEEGISASHYVLSKRKRDLDYCISDDGNDDDEGATGHHAESCRSSVSYTVRSEMDAGCILSHYQIPHREWPRRMEMEWDILSERLH